MAVGDGLAVDAQPDAQPVVAAGDVDGGAGDHAGAGREAPFEIGVGLAGQDTPHRRIEAHRQRRLQHGGGDPAVTGYVHAGGLPVKIGSRLVW